MKVPWPAVRWGLAALLVGASVWSFIATARHTPAPYMVGVPFEM